jgi:hypothetical protein
VNAIVLQRVRTPTMVAAAAISQGNKIFEKIYFISYYGLKYA